MTDRSHSLATGVNDISPAHPPARLTALPPRRPQCCRRMGARDRKAEPLWACGAVTRRVPVGAV